MICEKCGRENPPNAVNCIYCGNNLHKKHTQNNDINIFLIVCVCLMLGVVITIGGWLIYENITPKASFGTGTGAGVSGVVPDITDVFPPKGGKVQQPEKMPPDNPPPDIKQPDMTPPDNNKPVNVPPKQVPPGVKQPDIAPPNNGKPADVIPNQLPPDSGKPDNVPPNIKSPAWDEPSAPAYNDVQDKGQGF